MLVILTGIKDEGGCKVQFFKEYKKLKMAITGIIIVIATSFIPEIDEAALTKIVVLIISFIFGQGMADWSKEAKR